MTRKIQYFEKFSRKKLIVRQKRSKKKKQKREKLNKYMKINNRGKEEI